MCGINGLDDRQLLPIDGMQHGVASNNLSIGLLIIKQLHGRLIGSLHGPLIEQTPTL
jgi:hypothetical protein